MGLDELAGRLRQDAEQEKEKIRREAESQAQRERDKYCKDVDGAFEKELSKGARLAELSRKELVGNASIDAQVALSNAKQEIMNSVFEKSVEKILALSDLEKKKLLEKLAESKNQIDGKVKVLVDPKYQKLLKKTKDAEVHAEKDLGFGLVLESADGKIKIDCRITSLVAGLKNDLKPEIAQILWGEA